MNDYKSAEAFSNAIPTGQRMTSVPSSMDMAYTDWKCKKIGLYPRDTKSPTLYTISTHLRKPHLRYYHGDSTKPTPDSDSDDDTAGRFAAASCHSWSSKIDFAINGAEFTADRSGKLKDRYTYFSPSMNKEVTWTSNSGWKKIDYVLTDETGMSIARYTTEGMKLFSWSKMGRIEFDETAVGGLTDAMKDEAVVVGLALGYKLLMTLQSGASASSSSAAAAVAVSG